MFNMFNMFSRHINNLFPENIWEKWNEKYS